MADHAESQDRVAMPLRLAHHNQWDEIARYLGNLPDDSTGRRMQHLTNLAQAYGYTTVPEGG